MRERVLPQPATPKTTPTLPVQRKCKSCQEDEKRIQPALRMGSAGDPAEQEADRIGEQVAQRWHLSPLAAHPPLPVLRLSPAASIPSLQLPSLQSPIEQPHAGQPLPAPTRTFMEKQFAFDFSKVRIHHDSEAHADADNLGARAFTYGSHIYLGAEAQLTDQRLLAHELTHVVQQGAAGPQIQADLWYGRPRRIRPGQSPASPGTVAHEEILPIVGRANPNLFTEAPIPKGAPGSTSGDGRADFYLASTTLGLVFGEGLQPNWLDAGPELEKGGLPYGGHLSSAAPVGTTMPPPGQVHQIAQGPSDIKVGDLKPRGISHDGGNRQLNNYVRGMSQTRRDLEAFSTANPTLVSPGAWRPALDRIDRASVAIPPNHRTGTAGPTYPVVLYEGPSNVVEPTPRYAYLKLDWSDTYSGIMTYEYIPVGLDSGGLGALRNALSSGNLTQLRAIIGRLRDAPAQRSGRAQDTFDFSLWRRDWQRWRTQHGRPFERGRGATETLHLQAAQQIARRSGVGPTLPTDAPQLIGAGRQILHWEDWGEAHGRMRQIFGRLYVRAVELYQRVARWIRERFDGGRPRLPADGLAARVARITFNLVKTLATAAAAQTAIILGNAVETGVRDQLALLFSETGLDQLVAQAEPLRTLVADVEARISATVEAQMEGLLGPFRGWVDDFANIEAWFSPIMAVADVIKWAIRIAACGAPPPLLSCLWSVVGQQITEEVGAQLMETCWFKREILFPAMNRIAVVRDMPRWLATQLHGGLAGILPEGARPWLGSVPAAAGALRADEVACGGDAGRPSADPVTAAFLEMVQEFGEEYTNELLRTLQHLAGGRGSDRLTEAMLRQVRTLGQQHRARGGTVASLQRLRTQLGRTRRSWAEVIQTFERMSSGEGMSSGAEIDLSIPRPEPGRERTPRIELGPTSPRDDHTPHTGGVIIRF